MFLMIKKLPDNRSISNRIGIFQLDPDLIWSYLVLFDSICSYLILIDEFKLWYKLTWWPINFISNLRFSTLIRICSSESLQSFTNSSVFTNKGFNIGLFKNWFVVIDVSEFDSYPRLCHMVLIIVIVFTLKE